MSMSTLGSFSFLIKPDNGRELHLNTYINTSSKGDIIEFSCRYSPLPGEPYDYFISSNYRLSKIERSSYEAPQYTLDNSVMLRGTIEQEHASSVLSHVANDIEKSVGVLSNIIYLRAEDGHSFEKRIAYHLRSLRSGNNDINLSLRDRDFIIVVEVLALCLLGMHHSSSSIIKQSKTILDAVFSSQS